MYPTDRRYSKEHEWVLVEGDTAKMGITDFAQGELGDIVYVELPEPGKEFKAGDVMGTIESVKAVSEIYAPVSGTVTEVNSALDDDPMIINRDCYGDGWMLKVELSDEKEIEQLLDAGGYNEVISQA